MGFSQHVVSDFSGGFNDTSSAISLKDNELILSENADYSAEVKALQTRKGCIKVNENSFDAEVTDGYAWIVGSTYKKCIVMNGKLYDLNSDGTTQHKIDLNSGAKEIYPFVLYNVLYFGDGTDLYSWGAADYHTESGTVDIKTGAVVKCNLTNIELGTKGNFYMAKSSLGELDLSTQIYNDTTKWKDVTDAWNFSSSVTRKIKAHDPSCPEIVLISVTRSASDAGTVSINLNNITYTFSVAASDSVPQIVDKMHAMTTEGWTKAKAGNGVRFTRTEVGLSENGYVDPGSTGVTFTYETVQEGKINDCNLTDVKKCTIFTVHTASYRIFAAGNPDDNAIYYSEIGNPTYFKGDINKLYPAATGYGRITAIGNLSDALIISYENGWYSWTGTTPLSDAYWKPLNLPYGCVCHDSLALTPNSFTFLAKDGIYNVSASILSYEAVLIQGKDIIQKVTENTVEKTMLSIKNKRKCKASFYDNVYFLAYNTDGQNNDRILKYEWDTKSFTFVTGWKVNAWMSDPEHLYFTSANYVLQANEGHNDIDTETGQAKPINLHIKTKEYHMGTPISNKVFQMVGFIFKQYELEESSVDISIITGYETFRLKPIDLAESLVWGRAWGSTWGWREAIVKIAELTKVANTIQIEIENNNMDDPITLIGIGFVYQQTDLILPTILKDEVLLK